MIEIWMIEMTNLLTDSQHHTLLSDIAFEKQQRIKKFHTIKDAQRSLIGDISIRTLIFKHLSLRSQEINFVQNSYGKPFLQGYDNFNFNISHAGKYIACAVSDQPIGIDVEIIKPINLTFANRFFTKEESDYIFNGKTASTQRRRFYTIWTKKEAYVKLCGQGLHIPLHSFNVLNHPTNLSYLCIHQDASAICHICVENAEEPQVQYLSTETLMSLYDFYRK